VTSTSTVGTVSSTRLAMSLPSRPM
jgi:hypothetical protein